jgi:hypothetical protein
MRIVERSVGMRIAQILGMLLVWWGLEACDGSSRVVLQLADSLASAETAVSVKVVGQRSDLIGFRFIWKRQGVIISERELRRRDQFLLAQMISPGILDSLLAMNSPDTLELQVVALAPRLKVLGKSPWQQVVVHRPCASCDCIPFRVDTAPDTVKVGSASYEQTLTFSKPCETVLAIGGRVVMDDAGATEGKTVFTWKLDKGAGNNQTTLLSDILELRDLDGKVLATLPIELLVMAECDRPCQCIPLSLAADPLSLPPGTPHPVQKVAYTKPCGTQLSSNGQVLVADWEATRGSFDLPWTLSPAQVAAKELNLTRRIECMDTAGALVDSRDVTLEMKAAYVTLVVPARTATLDGAVGASVPLAYKVQRSRDGQLRWRLGRASLAGGLMDAGSVAVTMPAQAETLPLVVELMYQGRRVAADSVMVSLVPNDSPPLPPLPPSKSPEEYYTIGDMRALLLIPSDGARISSAATKADKERAVQAVWFRLVMAATGNPGRQFATISLAEYPLGQRLQDVAALHDNTAKLVGYDIFGVDAPLAFVEFRMWERVLPELVAELRKPSATSFRADFNRLATQGGVKSRKALDQMNEKQVKLFVYEYQLALADRMLRLQTTHYFPSCNLPKPREWSVQNSQKRCRMLNNLEVILETMTDTDAAGRLEEIRRMYQDGCTGGE